MVIIVFESLLFVRKVTHFVTFLDYPKCEFTLSQGLEHDQLAAASKAEDDVNFYQTVNPDVAKMFHIDPESKRPALVLVKSEEEKISHFGKSFVILGSAILFFGLCL